MQQLLPKITPESILYIDLDQVLVNFLGGAKKILKKEFNDDYQDSYWEILGNFWEDLPWMPEAEKLWEVAARYNGEILSCCPEPHLSQSCPKGKLKWCERNLNIKAERVHIVTQRNQKRLLAINGNIPNVLVDDHPKNVADWREAGGIAVWHLSVAETLSELEKLGYV